MKHYINEDSFGAELPKNWEDIADALNDIIDERGIASDPDAVGDLWESYCSGKLQNVPAAEGEKEGTETMVKAWKVYGADGHRQRESFAPSQFYDFSCGDETRKIWVLNSDRTGTNEYTIVRIEKRNAEECDAEFNGQLTDGIFENSRTGRIDEIDPHDVDVEGMVAE